MDEGRIGRLAWRRLEPFGAEVDFDFRQPLDAVERAGFRALLFARRMILARGQALSLAQQQQVAGYIGPVLRGARGLAEISPKDGILNEAPLAWHSDLAFAPEPFTALSLHAVDVAEGRTSTRFADSVLAAATLPPQLRAKVEGREAVFVQPLSPSTRQIDVQGRHAPVARALPVLMSHPVTNEVMLFVNEQHVDRMADGGLAEGHALLSALFDHLYAPAHVLEHVWRNGDLILWDNLALQHGRPDVAGIRPRRLQRASVARRSLAEQIPDFFKGRQAPAAAQAGY
jgi:taurine dioxygenase